MEEKRRLIEYRKPRTGELLTFKTRQYFVEADGRVWNEERKRYLKPHELKEYLAVSLMDDEGKQHVSIGVHCLVASCFIRLLQKGENCHHRDHDKKNNNLFNLEIIDGGEHSRQHNYEKWMDGTYNKVGEKVATKLRNVGSNKPAKQVAQLTLDGRLVKVWPSTAEAGRNGFFNQTVSACCRGERKKHHGFRWQYLEDYQRAQQLVSQPVQIELGN